LNTQQKLFLGIAVVVIVAGGVAAFYLLPTKTWSIKDVSTASKPLDPVYYNGRPCSECKVIGPNVVTTAEEYAMVKTVTRPDGWRADITWWAPRERNEFLSLEALRDLPWKFRAASFVKLGAVGSNLQSTDEWQKVIADAERLNGPYTGRVKPDATDTTAEFVYWGRVTINKGDPPTYNCATDCLVFFLFGEPAKGTGYYTTYLSAKMRSGVWKAPVP
jgi:hypothetical protein